MGRLSAARRASGRRIAWAVTMALATSLIAVSPAAAFDGFGDIEADATYGESMQFAVELRGQAPDRLELLLRTPGDEGDFVSVVAPRGGTASYIWDVAAGYVTPNTPVTYRWRATEGDEVTLSDEGVLLYDDDRPGLDWQSATLGEATVHWYGDSETRARRFGELVATGAEQATELLGTSLADPVDVFVYDTREEFFGALGPTAREWTGAAAFPELRTIFMWLGGGTEDYLEVAVVHEVTHVVFFDATDNPYHKPARWLNEGIATWSETHDAEGEQGLVESEARAGRLLSFDAITDQFPINERGGRLAYAQGTVMVDRIVDRFGAGAMAAIADAYRQGAGDDEALEAGTGIGADALYADFFATFGVEPPQAVAAEPILPSNVDLPPGASAGGAGPTAPPAGPAVPTDEDGPGAATAPALVIVAIVVGVALALGAVLLVRRRTGGGASS